MSLKGERRIFHFLIVQLLCLMTELLIIAVYYRQEKYIIPFAYSFPVLILFMILYYFLFWRPTKENIGVYMITNLILFMIGCGLYFGVFYGIFYKTLKINFQEVSNCSVIGKESTNLNGNELYSILYVNFEQNGQQKLGYACQSSQNESPNDSRIIPNEFYFYKDKFQCSSINGDIDQNKRLLKLSQNSPQLPISPLQTEANLSQKKQKTSSHKIKPQCYDYYTFSQVKLPSWVCLPWNTSFESLIEKQNCYLNYYGNSAMAQDNSLNRSPLKESKQFALISFNQLPVPLKSYVCFLIFVFNFLILSFNGLYFYLIIVVKLIIKSYLSKEEPLIQSIAIPIAEIKTEENELFEENKQHVKPKMFVHTKSATNNNKDIINSMMNNNQVKLNSKTNSKSSQKDGQIFIKTITQGTIPIENKDQNSENEKRIQADQESQEKCQQIESIPTQNDEVTERSNFIFQNEQCSVQNEYPIEMLSHQVSNNCEESLNKQNASIDRNYQKDDVLCLEYQNSKTYTLISNLERKKKQAATTSFI